MNLFHRALSAAKVAQSRGRLICTLLRSREVPCPYSGQEASYSEDSTLNLAAIASFHILSDSLIILSFGVEEFELNKPTFMYGFHVVFFLTSVPCISLGFNCVQVWCVVSCDCVP